MLADDSSSRSSGNAAARRLTALENREASIVNVIAMRLGVEDGRCDEKQAQQREGPKRIIILFDEEEGNGWW